MSQNVTLQYHAAPRLLLRFQLTKLAKQDPEIFTRSLFEIRIFFNENYPIKFDPDLASAWVWIKIVCSSRYEPAYTVIKPQETHSIPKKSNLNSFEETKEIG